MCSPEPLQTLKRSRDDTDLDYSLESSKRTRQLSESDGNNKEDTLSDSGLTHEDVLVKSIRKSDTSATETTPTILLPVNIVSESETIEYGSSSSSSSPSGTQNSPRGDTGASSSPQPDHKKDSPLSATGSDDAPGSLEPTEDEAFIQPKSTEVIQPQSEVEGEVIFSSPPTSRQLPMELHHNIIEHLFGDECMNALYYRSLKSYALVCSWWRLAVRPYIFRFLVLRGPRDFEKLIAQVRDDPSIAEWIRTIRLQGQALPYVSGGFGPLEGVERDPDTGLYSFPAVIDFALPNLKILEFVGFAQISTNLEDCKAFAAWIPKLATLTTITRLNFVRCEMTQNSFTAIVRALPNLRDVSLVAHGYCFRENSTVLRDESASKSRLPDVADDEEREPAKDKETISPSDEKPCEETISFPVYNSPPLLRSLYITTPTSFGIDDVLFDHVAGWFHPELLNDTLESLVLSLNVPASFTAKTFGLLGPSPKLRHLQVQYSSFEGVNIELEHDISSLTNLRTVRIYGDEDNIDLNSSMSVIRRYLLQFGKHALHLEEISIELYYEDKASLEAFSTLDSVLAGDGFNKLKLVKLEVQLPMEVECNASLKTISKIFRDVRETFPLVQKRAAVKAIMPLSLYPWRATGGRVV